MAYEGYYRKDYKLSGKASPAQGEKSGRGVSNLKDTQRPPRDYNTLARVHVPGNESDKRKTY